MLKRIEDRAGEQDYKEFVKTATEMVAKYGWELRTVSPWGFAEKVPEVIKQVGCRQTPYRRTLANGLAQIMNAWENTEVNGVSIVTKSGKVIKVSKEDADELVADGYAQYA